MITARGLSPSRPRHLKMGCIMRRQRNLSIRLLVLLLLVSATAVEAYTVYLKDGSQVVCDGKYTIDGDKAILVLPGGTHTSLAVSEIDVRRTEVMNKDDYGTAKVFHNQQTLAGSTADASLSTLAAQRGRRSRLGEQTRREATTSEGEVAKTPAGYVDLTRFRRSPLSDHDLAVELGSVLRTQGVEGFALYKGTEEGRLLVDVTTNSEAAVFRAIEVSARALLQIAEEHPDQIQAFELLMVNHRKQRAGQFLIDRERAEALAAKQIDIPHFFLEYVEF